MPMIEEGWIDEVDDGIVWGRTVRNGEEWPFWIPLLLVMESQRVDLQPGSYIYIVNGELMVNGAIWTTHEMEQASTEANELWNALFGDGHRSIQ
ncbi:hypothetical protein GWE18_00525 [Bradyrhizobium sp. CSA112]|uniref:hypothetical protein n=1 Tax=Bradyrhizobium sp. CSA112 TaxID=2699170 RepID=UPI0023B0D297|nr:hypothetical protein [Bradyrhizobium sp. CSA112]MDE5451361.1 hypothetical protein [Bradyrhizobium sp. CSA112]